MQQQSPSQQASHQPANIPYHQGQFPRSQQQPNYRSVPNQRMSRQPQQQQPSVVQPHPTNANGTQPILANNVMMPRNIQYVSTFPHFGGQPFNSGYSPQLQFSYAYQLQPHTQGTDSSGYAMINSVQSNNHMPAHRQPQHQQMGPQITMATPSIHNSYMLQQIQRPKETSTKRAKQPIPIINPKTNEEVIVNVRSDQTQSSSNTHSAALKIEAPSPAHNENQIDTQNIQSLNSRTVPPTQSTSDGSANILNANAIANDNEQITCDPNPEHQIDNEEPPTTPIVSANADGPSVDITPKQTKNYKRTINSNKSPEWPLPSIEKSNPDSSMFDNSTKLATSTVNVTSSGNNEWVNKNATKTSTDSAAKDQNMSHQPKHQKSKQSCSTQSNKSKAIPIESPPKETFIASTRIETGKSSTSAKMYQQPQHHQHNETNSNKRDDITSNSKHSEKHLHYPQSMSKNRNEPLTNKSSESANIDNITTNSSTATNSNNKVSTTTPIAKQSVKKSEAIEKDNQINKPVTDKTEKVISSFASMTIDVTNVEPNDKLDAELVTSCSTGSNVTQSKSNETQSKTTYSIDIESKNDSQKIKQTNQELEADTSRAPKQQQQNENHESNLGVIKNDSPKDSFAEGKSSSILTTSKTANRTTTKDVETASIRATEAEAIESSYVNTKDNKNISIDISIDSGLAEKLNNIKNNNLTNTPSTNNQLNNNNSVILDKDLDNNPITTQNQDDMAILTVTETSPKTATVEQKSWDQSNDALSTEQTATPVSTAATPTTASTARQTKLTYSEGQWSPDTPEGRKFYDRHQLVQLRDTIVAKEKPEISSSFHHLFKATNSNFTSNSNSNNNKNQSSSSNNRNPYNKRPSAQGGQGGNQQMQQGGGKGSKSGMIHLTLSLREEVKLNESANAWKPTFISNSSGNSGSNVTAAGQDLDNIEVLCKRVRGILNKLTPEKFDPLLEQLQALNIDNNEKLSSVISLVFEKAIDEPHFSAAYAQLCQKLSKPLEDKEKREKDGKNTEGQQKTSIFKKELLTKCQKEFDTHVANENSIRSKLLPMQEELASTTDENRKMELKVLIEEEERKLRRRSVGTVRFIGELYLQNMLLTRIMEWCVIILLSIPTEEKLECLCKLLTTVGQKMETKTGDEAHDAKYYRDLTPHFQTMQNIANDKKQQKVSSRVRFMLLDVIDLRKNKWVPRRADSNPKKMGQIQKEAEQEQYTKQIQMLVGNSGINNNMRKDNRDRNDRGSMRSDLRSSGLSGGGYMNNNNGNKLNRGNYQDSDGWIQQGSNKNRSGNNSTFDPTKFRSSNVEDLTKTTLGAPNQFQWNFNTQPKPPTNITNSFSALESDSFKQLSGNRSKEPYHSKGSMERDRGSVSRSGSQHGSRDSSTARNSYSSRSLQQMRPPQMQYNTLPINSSSSPQNRIRNDKNESTSQSTSNLSPSASITPATSDPKLSEDVSDENLTAIKSTIKKYLSSIQRDDFREYDDLQEATRLDDHKNHHRWAVVRELYNLAVDTSGLNETKRCFIGTVCAYWCDQKQITKQDYVRGLSEFITILDDIVIDVPKIYEWTVQMISVPVFKDIITLNDLKNTAEGSRAKLLGMLLPYLAYEYSPQYVRDLWRRSKCRWDQFVVNDDVEQFVEKNKLKFVENADEKLAPINTPISNDRLRHRIRELIRKENFSEREISEYIEIHVPKINKQNVRLLTKLLVEAAIDKSKTGYSLNDTYLKGSIQILKVFVGGEDRQNFQLESLYAIQLLSNELEHPSGFMIKIFNKLYEDDVCPSNVFKAWCNSNEEPLGKGVAVKNLNNFFKILQENEEDSDGESGE